MELDGDSSTITAEAVLARVEGLMKDYHVLEAEEVIAQAFASLRGRAGEAEEAEQAIAAIQRSPIFQTVSDRIAQYDAACAMLSATNMKLLYEAPEGKFELYQPAAGRWFDYRITMNIDAPLCECIASMAEIDLIHHIQTMFSKPLEPLGEWNNWTLVRSCGEVNVKVFNVDLRLETMRVPESRFGFVIESVRSEFPTEGLNMPNKKGWFTVKPWISTTNTWMPRGGEERGTVLVQVTRVDVPMTVPQAILDFVFRNLAKSFMGDLQKGASKALDPESPWAKRIAEDRFGMYAKLRDLEAVARQRGAVSAQSMPGSSVFDRPWRLKPTPQDTRPPSSRPSK